jgi:predicted DNA-binding protein with PD1-like motif
MHGVLSDEDCHCVGGHIKEAVVGATFEAYIVDFGKEIRREMDSKIGLRLLQCERGVNPHKGS